MWKPIINNVVNCAPCHLPNIDPTIDVSLCKPEQSLACELCRFMDEEDKMLLCDACGTGWHTTCLDPPLPAVPKGDWLCPRCVKDGVTLADVEAERARQNAKLTSPQAPTRRLEPLFKDAATRRRVHEQSAYDGRVIAANSRKGGKELVIVKYLGPAAGLKCYEARLKRAVVHYSATEVKRRLMPQGTVCA